jgi:hypothetical protein
MSQKPSSRLQTTRGSRLVFSHLYASNRALAELPITHNLPPQSSVVKAATNAASSAADAGYM